MRLPMLRDHDCSARRLCRARTRKWLETWRPATVAPTQVIHFVLSIIVSCGVCFPRELSLKFRATRHPTAARNSMNSFSSNNVPMLNVALHTAQELPLDFAVRRHHIALYLRLESVIASLEAPNRCAFVLHPDLPVVSYLQFILVASDFA